MVCDDNERFKKSYRFAKIETMDDRDRKMHIMLAEDDADEREFFEEALESLKRNVRLDVFNNGRELLAGLMSCKERGHCPDIIFLDLNMPIVNGLEALQQIRLVEEFSCVPIVTILTTSDAEKDKILTFSRGADAFMSKPSSYGALVGLIEKVIDMDWESRSRTIENFILKL